MSIKFRLLSTIFVWELFWHIVYNPQTWSIFQLSMQLLFIPRQLSSWITMYSWSIVEKAKLRHPCLGSTIIVLKGKGNAKHILHRLEGFYPVRTGSEISWFNWYKRIWKLCVQSMYLIFTNTFADAVFLCLSSVARSAG